MNRRELAFCAAYVESGSAREAAILAGYSLNYIKSKLRYLLDRPPIQEMINRLLAKMETTMALDAAQVVNQLGAMALTRPDEFLIVGENGLYRWKTPDELNDRQRSAIKRIDLIDCLSKADETGVRTVIDQKFKYTFYDKAQALAQLGNHFSAFGRDGIEQGQGNRFRDMSAEKIERIGRAMKNVIDAEEAMPETEEVLNG